MVIILYVFIRASIISLRYIYILYSSIFVSMSVTDIILPLFSDKVMILCIFVWAYITSLGYSLLSFFQNIFFWLLYFIINQLD